jgi:LL-diaminopimelate aminotransferase
MIEPAQRIKQLPRYLFAEIDKKIREALDKGVDVIRLGIGDPDTPTPDYIIERMSREIREPGNHRYPPDEGLPEFKEAVADYYGERHHVSLQAGSEVLPLIGSKEGIANIHFAFVNPGDLNIVPDPGYPVYGIGTTFAGGEVYRMPLLEENNFLPVLEDIPEQAAHKAKLLFINYPNNPTGAAAPEEFFERVVAFARKYNVLVCHDSAYSEVAYDGYRPLSFLEIDGAKEVGIEFNSLSKTFNMTGWRIGYAVGNAQALEVLSRFKTNVDSGVFKAIQYTGVEALRNPARTDFINGLQKLYQERRDAAMEGLKSMGWSITPPKAGFYIWAPVPKGYTSQDFVGEVLEKTGVVITPGRGFGEHGEGYFRIALTVDVTRIREAFSRLKNFIFTQPPY